MYLLRLNVMGMGLLDKLHRYTFEIRLERHRPRTARTVPDEREKSKCSNRRDETILLGNKKSIAETGKVTSLLGKRMPGEID